MTSLERRGCGHEADALRTEAEVLRSLQLPGLPTVVSLEDQAGQVVLRTEVPGGTALRDHVPLTPRTAAGIVLAVAATARDLSEAGVNRGAIALDQIHLAGGTRPVLMHLAGAELAGDTPGKDRGAADFGRLLLSLLPPPGRRGLRLRDDAATKLRRVGHRASDPSVTLDRFSAMVREAAPDGALPSLPADPPPVPEDQGRVVARLLSSGRWRAAVCATIALLAMTSAATVLLRPGPPSTGATVATTSPASSLPAASPEEEPPPGDDAVAVWPRYGCAPDGGATIEIVGEACPQPASVRGTTVSVGPRSWSVGGQGSYALALGDWDCSGNSSVAALDVQTGELWLFAPPTADAEASVASFVGRAPGAVALIGRTGGCGPIQPADAGGAPVPVTPGPEVEQ